MFALYGAPYMFVNAWLTLITWLQHSDVKVAHYDESTWDWFTGAIATIDRNFPAMINAL